MNKSELQQKLAIADTHIGFLVDFFTNKFSVVTGKLEKIGSMESSTTITTNTTGGVVGQVGSNGGFGAVGTANSTTSAQVSRSISLLKIGNKSMTDVSIPNSGFFDAIDFGDEIGVIMSEDEKSLFYIHDYSDNSSVGQKPSCSSDLGRWGFLAVSLFLVWMTLGDIYTSITTLSMPSLGLPIFAVLFFILYRASHLGSVNSALNWNRALHSLLETSSHN